MKKFRGILLKSLKDSKQKGVKVEELTKILGEMMKKEIELREWASSISDLLYGSPVIWSAIDPVKALECFDSIKYEAPETNFEEDIDNNSFWFLFHQIRKLLMNPSSNIHRCQAVCQNYRLYLSYIRNGGDEYLFSPRYVMTKLFTIHGYTRAKDIDDFDKDTEYNVMLHEYVKDAQQDDKVYKVIRKTNSYIFVNEILPVFKDGDFKLYRIDNLNQKVERFKFRGKDTRGWTGNFSYNFVMDNRFFEVKGDYFMF